MGVEFCACLKQTEDLQNRLCNMNFHRQHRQAVNIGLQCYFFLIRSELLNLCLRYQDNSCKFFTLCENASFYFLFLPQLFLIWLCGLWRKCLCKEIDWCIFITRIGDSLCWRKSGNIALKGLQNIVIQAHVTWCILINMQIELYFIFIDHIPVLTTKKVVYKIF